MPENRELVVNCRNEKDFHQPWWPSAEVKWINDSDPLLKEAGIVALGFHNGAVFLANTNQNIKLGDKVKITNLTFRKPGLDEKYPSSNHVVTKISE